MKTAAQYFGEELLPLLGITAEVRYAAPTENVRLEARQMYQDFNYITSGGTWIHLEFESDSVTREDLRRFREYEAATSPHIPGGSDYICNLFLKCQKTNGQTGRGD